MHLQHDSFNFSGMQSRELKMFHECKNSAFAHSASLRQANLRRESTSPVHNFQSSEEVFRKPDAVIYAGDANSFYRVVPTHDLSRYAACCKATMKTSSIVQAEHRESSTETSSIDTGPCVPPSYFPIDGANGSFAGLSDMSVSLSVQSIRGNAPVTECTVEFLHEINDRREEYSSGKPGLRMHLHLSVTIKHGRVDAQKGQTRLSMILCCHASKIRLGSCAGHIGQCEQQCHWV